MVQGYMNLQTIVQVRYGEIYEDGSRANCTWI